MNKWHLGLGFANITEYLRCSLVSSEILESSSVFPVFSKFREKAMSRQTEYGGGYPLSLPSQLEGALVVTLIVCMREVFAVETMAAPWQKPLDANTLMLLGDDVAQKTPPGV
nr:unnamed protein product [Callosobruchus chinensis]